MQKNLPDYAPEWIHTVTTWAERSRREVRYALCNDRRTLLWFANQRAVEFHPALYRTTDAGRASVLVLDIDPPESASFDQVVAAALAVREALQEVGLAGAVKTSGAKGVHTFVPISPVDPEIAAAATRAVAVRAARLDPDVMTTAFVVDERDGKVFVDSIRAGGATVAAAYSPRLRAGLPVSYPVGWDDLPNARPEDFTIFTAPRLLGDDDRWAEQLPAPQTVPDVLIAEGRDIPIARVQAMHAGKRRARERRDA